MQARRQRKSELLDAINLKIKKLVELIAKTAEITLSPTLGLDILTRSCAQKQALLLQVCQSLSALKKEMSNNRLLNDLRQ